MKNQTDTSFAAGIKLNVGCGGRPLDGYVNIDQDSLDQLRSRYPRTEFSDSLIIQNHDIFNLPYADDSVDEVRADGLLEHLSFKEEPLFLYEVRRVLVPNGRFTFSVPDFEEICSLWLSATDDWKEFFSDSPEDIQNDHWFGTYSYGYENRWGYLTATLYGSQYGTGQYHKNCYSVKKIEKMMAHLNFCNITTRKFLWKGNRDPMIHCEAVKKS